MGHYLFTEENTINCFGFFMIFDIHPVINITVDNHVMGIFKSSKVLGVTNQLITTFAVNYDNVDALDFRIFNSFAFLFLFKITHTFKLKAVSLSNKW